MQIAIEKGKFSKIALMGYSAGGHLAMLYAYKAANGDRPYGDKIQLVVSEAGPTDLTTDWGDLQSVVNGVVGSSANENKAETSPINHISDNVPFTILAYGNGIPSSFHHYDGYNGDGLIPYAQVTAITEAFGELDNPEKYYALYVFNRVGHSEFGGGKKVCPNSQIPGEWANAIEDYYDKLQDKLT